MKIYDKKIQHAGERLRKATDHMETLALVYGVIYSEEEAPMTDEMRQAIRKVVRTGKQLKKCILAAIQEMK